MTPAFAPQPHAEAMALIRDKPPVTRRVFDGLLPELRGRAFTITGIEAANVMQRVRDEIAALPQGTPWKEVKQEVVDAISPYIEDPERRAEILIRTHGFEAFNASNYRVAQEDQDTTHLQYLATEDDRVRDSHLALNGVTLPKDDAFWATHTPPWEWGCRCRIRPMNPDLVELEREADQNRNPEDRNVIEGPALDQLHAGTILRDGRRFDVTPPVQRGDEKPFVFHPDNLRLSVGDLEARYADQPEAWDTFRRWAANNLVRPGLSVWQWLTQSPAAA